MLLRVVAGMTIAASMYCTALDGRWKFLWGKYPVHRREVLGNSRALVWAQEAGVSSPVDYLVG